MRDRAECIRLAVGRGDLAEARSMWLAWVAELNVRAPHAGEWPCFSEVYEWSRRALICERARIREDLNALHAAGSYLG